MRIRFLLDENLDPRLKTALLRLNPTIDVVRVGEPMVWEASAAEEWLDRLEWIPL